MKLFTALIFSSVLAGSGLHLNASEPKPANSPLQLDEMKQLRKKAAQRQRRVLFNDDGNEVLPYTTPEELIALRVKQVANTQVDTIMYCTGGGGLFWGHQAKVGETLGEFVDKSDPHALTMSDSLATLKEQGTDPLAEVVKYGHANNMEIIWSYRMNNPEDSFVDWGFSRRKRQHPEYIMGKKSDWDHNNLTEAKVWWALEDFDQDAVRDHIVDIFEDVCKRYDIDGIELDFIRHPLFFRPNLDGKPATAEQVAKMTDMVRKIRAVTERVSLERGRPILVSVRAPLSVQSGLDIGLDIPTYLKEDLMDILIAGQDYVQMGVASDLKDMVTLAHQYDVPVYALIVPPKPYQIYTDSRAWRGAVMNRWYWGADGIYTFNLFPNKPDAKFSEFGSPETLKGLDKIYAIDNPIDESVLGTFKMVMVAPDRLPLALSHKGYATAKLSVGEDIVANTPDGKTVSTELRFQIPGLAKSDKVEVKVNGRNVGSPSPGAPGYSLTVDPKLFKPGFNNIDLRLLGNSTENASNAQVSFLDLVVSYK